MQLDDATSAMRHGLATTARQCGAELHHAGAGDGGSNGASNSMT